MIYAPEIHVLIILTFVALGGAVRWFDGTSGHIFGVHIPGALRSSLMGVVALGAAAYSIMDWWALWPASVATACLWMGYTEWQRWWMAARFGLPAMIAVAPWIFGVPGEISWGIVGYMVAGFAAGLAYPVLMRLGDRVDLAVGPADGPEWWCRWIAGGLLFGGLSWI